MKTNRAKHSRRTAGALVPPAMTAEMEGGNGAVAQAPQAEGSAAAVPVTRVAAKIDVGLGNRIFIRGQGNGLSWNKGTPLDCRDASTWVWSATQAKEKTVFKLLLNDHVWASGQDLVVEPGKTIELVPSF